MFRIYSQPEDIWFDNRILAEHVRSLTWRFRVLAFDNRGAGRSDKPDQPYTIDQMAGDTEGLMRALGIERAHVLGISLGGRIALALALAHPERVACPRLNLGTGQPAPLVVRAGGHRVRPARLPE